MLPPEVKNLKIKDGVEFDTYGNAVKFKEYTFFIGTHGPFTEKFYAGEQDTPAIERRINLAVQQLRELGALAGGTPAS
jgi:hypothetical protein